MNVTAATEDEPTHMDDDWGLDLNFRILKSKKNKNYEVFCRQVARKFKISDDVEIDGEADYLDRIFVGEEEKTIRLWNIDVDGRWIIVSATYFHH